MIAIIPMLLVSALFLGPLCWRIWLDKRTARANVIRADIRAAVNRRLDGESVLSVMVKPPSLARAGRVIVSTPSGYEWLVEQAWRDLVRHTPAGYDLVLKSPEAGRIGSVAAADARALPRAA